ncbi:hypothetical protein [Bacteroides helcogenes]|uniref:Transmembrane protein n=1 Tax=Bacteroides helcogenes (strain ATCC 35417 / DSM 20613 / JCM 6297 / CCUG 15421 / P 36-108) TaxID=693979 RepID=E6SV26_BACT6|nr:hypothetical protein [Bacteroides helcogenes]ADV43408.1 hypothetical protein Bache_1403 [Bacteroides helcogenes P 36-108]MDY5238175.1 hypothetical protein [Bacteroides helcogenes]
MKREYKGCLVSIAIVVIFVGIQCIGIWTDIPFLKHISYICCGSTCAYVGGIYFSSSPENPNKQWSRKTWILIAIVTLVVAAALSWLLDGKLW